MYRLQNKSISKLFLFSHLYYNFFWKDEHECMPSVHDQTSKGNYNKDAEIKKTIKNSFDIDFFYNPYI